MALKPTPIVIGIEPFGGSIRNHNPSLPLLFADDAAVTRGDGVFETLLLRNGSVANFERHFQRFAASAEMLELPSPIEKDWQRATHEAVQMWHDQMKTLPEIPDAMVVWTLSRGRESTGIPSAWLTVKAVGEHIFAQREHGVAVMTSPRGYHVDTQADVPWLTMGAKTLSYAATMAALRWAKRHGFDDVLYVEGERVLEGATSTVISIKGNKIRTPISGKGILAGTTQAAIFEYATAQGWRCKQKDLTLDDLSKADSVWLVSSVRMAARITAIDGKKLPKPENEAEIHTLIARALGH